jgi:hypothetical protein
MLKTLINKTKNGKNEKRVSELEPKYPQGNCITGCSYCQLIDEVHGVVVMIVYIYQCITGLLSISFLAYDI